MMLKVIYLYQVMKIFGYTVNFKILKKVMASLKDVTNKNDKKLDLTEEETIFLLSTLKNSTFKGSQVEILYNIALKLQNYYNSITKN